MKRRLQALIVLILFGVLKLPIDAGLTQRLRDENLLNPPVDYSLRDSLGEEFGQMTFAAALGGLRSLIASFFYLQASHEFENVNWAKVDQLFQVIVRLQPRYAGYWDEAAWQMAMNAASSTWSNEKLELNLRRTLAEQYVQRGIDIIHQGLLVLPKDAKLWLRLAEIYDYTRVPKYQDHAKAGDAYLKAYESSKFALYNRLAGYQYAKSSDPALWRKSYDLLMDAYQKHQRQPSVITTLKSLEGRLNIPPALRIPDPEPNLRAPARR